MSYIWRTLHEKIKIIINFIGMCFIICGMWETGRRTGTDTGGYGDKYSGSNRNSGTDCDTGADCNTDSKAYADHRPDTDSVAAM